MITEVVKTTSKDEKIEKDINLQTQSKRYNSDPLNCKF